MIYDSDLSKDYRNLIKQELYFNQACMVFNKPNTKRNFHDYERSALFEERLYAI